MLRKRRRHQTDPGYIKCRLAKVLQRDLGLIVDPCDLWTQQGAYRSHYWDLARWGAYHCLWDAQKQKQYAFTHEFSITSWDTMTEMCQKGAALVDDPRRERITIEISVH
jgi:hypothetical protein